MGFLSTTHHCEFFDKTCVFWNFSSAYRKVSQKFFKGLSQKTSSGRVRAEGYRQKFLSSKINRNWKFSKHLKLSHSIYFVYSDLQIGTMIVNQKGLCLCYCNTCHNKRNCSCFKGISTPKSIPRSKGISSTQIATMDL